MPRYSASDWQDVPSSGRVLRLGGIAVSIDTAGIDRAIRCRPCFVVRDFTNAQRAAFGTAKLNDIDPQALLADVLARSPDHPVKRISELLPWRWRRQNGVAEAI